MYVQTGAQMPLHVKLAVCITRPPSVRVFETIANIRVKRKQLRKLFHALFFPQDFA